MVCNLYKHYYLESAVGSKSLKCDPGSNKWHVFFSVDVNISVFLDVAEVLVLSIVGAPHACSLVHASAAIITHALGKRRVNAGPASVTPGQR